MPLTSASQAWLRIGEYEYPRTDQYAQEIPFGKIEGVFAPAGFGTNHGFGAAAPRWDDLHTDAGGGVTTYSYPVGG